MSRFSDHFSATVLAETFMKIFFSGPMGRMAAVVFLSFYLALKALFFALRVVWIVVSWTFGTFFRTFAKTFGPDFVTRRAVSWKLRESARKFGDAVEFSGTLPGGWRSATVSGEGFRTGPFRLGFFWHPATGAVRFRHAYAGRDWQDLPPESVLAVLSRPYPFPVLRDVPLFYENARTHFL